MRQQIRRVKLRDQVADMLVEMISSGEYGAGDRLPPERILVEQLGVSRTVVREALNLLETRGLIRVEHGRGAIVSADGADALQNNLEFLLRMEPSTLWELMEMRKALEVEGARIEMRKHMMTTEHDMRATIGD